MKNDKKIFFENLDGLRFLSFLSVFLYHSFYTESCQVGQNKLYLFLTDRLFANGNLGVNFFFVLSGFLITFLLIEEKLKTNKIHVVNFWMRRVLKIWPLFYFAVIFGFFGFPFLKSLFGQTPNETAQIGYYLSFLNNFNLIKNGLPDASILGVLWSVAIEEQFYFIWPIILYFFPVKKYWIPFLLIIFSSIIFRSITNSDILNEHHTLSCIGDMSIGALGAWLIHKERIKLIVKNLKKYQIISVYVIFILVFLFRKELFFENYILRVIERPFIAIIILFIILEQNFSKNSFFKMKNFKTISKLGIITYGLYCLHFIGILITLTLMKKLHFSDNLFNIIVIETLVSLFLSIIIAKISYKYFESPFLKLKKRFSHIKTR
ncbi:MAG: acyltransferase [Bacteroidetes bacterium]|nr:acyltransferase [Bacteroidota bacterium]